MKDLDKKKIVSIYEATSMARQHALTQEIKRRMKAGEPPMTAEERTAFLNVAGVKEQKQVSLLFEGLAEWEHYKSIINPLAADIMMPFVIVDPTDMKNWIETKFLPPILRASVYSINARSPEGKNVIPTDYVLHSHRNIICIDIKYASTNNTYVDRDLYETNQIKSNEPILIKIEWELADADEANLTVFGKKNHIKIRGVLYSSDYKGDKININSLYFKTVMGYATTFLTSITKAMYGGSVNT